MIQIKHILIPTDGSDYALIAAEYGLDVAKNLGATVQAVCVFDYNAMGSVDYSNTREYIDNTCTKCLEPVIKMGKTKNVNIKTTIATGDPAKAIVEMSENYDLIIMGTVGRTGLTHAIMGSVAEKVVRLSKCPVLVYKNK